MSQLKNTFIIALTFIICTDCVLIGNVCDQADDCEKTLGQIPKCRKTRNSKSPLGGEGPKTCNFHGRDVCGADDHCQSGKCNDNFQCLGWEKGTLANCPSDKCGANGCSENSCETRKMRPTGKKNICKCT